MSDLILFRDLDGHKIGQRRADGFINATALCKAAGKLWADYARLSNTEEFFAEISSDMGIPISGLVQVRKGGDPRDQGTWVHPDIAIDCAYWCNARFRLRVTRWVNELITPGRVELAPAQAPLPWGHRYRQTFGRHLQYMGHNHPDAFTIYSGLAGDFITAARKMLRDSEAWPRPGPGGPCVREFGARYGRHVTRYSPTPRSGT